MNFLRKLRSFHHHLKCTFATSSSMSSPIVSVKEGKIKGAEEKLFDGSTYYSFKGIPYAEPPVGKLRFKAPQPPKPWSGILEATAHGGVCPQFDINTATSLDGDESCLFLNVYTKSLSPLSKLPVMVFIHGGGFMSGSGDDNLYGPKYLVQHQVILVTFNYRLEVLGFLCLDIPEVPGNAGLKDQVAALRWVKNNISQFGGDPTNVSILGESAGGASVTYHILSAMSKGLFQKAISQSGNCLEDWALGVDNINRAFRVGKLLGKETNDPYELLDHLQSVPASSLVNITRKTSTEDEKYRGLPLRFVPVIEKKFDDVEPFIDKDPVNILAAKAFDSVPLMIGYNSNEGTIAIKDKLRKADFFNDNPELLVPRCVASRVTAEQLVDFGVRLKGYYVGDAALGEETAQRLADMQSDTHFVYNCHRFVHYYVAMNTPVYMFKFSCDTELNFIKILLDLSEYEGTCHADDLFYVFSNMMNKSLYTKNERLRNIIFRITKLWTNFAKTGNPTPDNSLGVEWTPYTRSNKAYLDINEKLTMGLNAESNRVEFWNKLYADAGVPCCIKSSL